MTDVQAAADSLAERIAQRGRDALVERLRKAFSDAAMAHADIVTLDDERIEAMVQAAADRADGLQWRRALANVAADELGLSLAEALTHPAVARAQELVGAPSYEAGLAELIARPVPPAAPASAAPAQNGATPEPSPADEPELYEASGELDVVEADDAVFELLPPPEPIDYAGEEYEALPEEVQEPAPPVLEQVPYEPEPEQAPEAAAAPLDEYVGAPTETHELEDEAPAAESYGGEYGSEHVDYPPAEDQELRVTAHHLGGVANLPTGRTSLDLRLSESGLDILQSDGDIIGRLHWNEIDLLEVNAVRGRLRRQARAQSRIVVRTKHGDASFEIPGMTSDELRARVDPLLTRYASGS